ncbi:TcpE family conjugal transfer membrane protein [Nonomuraea bangladeshensis]|uniref:TcpE family conjugal transfer membrane protein n=1 Tax=Nonomuraea bangladeshensis TaxID=404385 RepID=UPI003C2B725C
MREEDRVDLPTYTNIWRIEKRLYKLYDLRLPMPLPIVWIGVFVGVFVPWSLLLILVGVPVAMPWHVLFLVPPGIVTWLSTRPVIEGKRLTELLESQMRYLGEPKAWYRLAPGAEPETVTFSARVWRTAPVRVKARRPAKARQAQRRAEEQRAAGPRQVRPAVAAAAAAAGQAPVAEPTTGRTGWGSRRGTAPALRGRARQGTAEALPAGRERPLALPPGTDPNGADRPTETGRERVRQEDGAKAVRGRARARQEGGAEAVRGQVRQEDGAEVVRGRASHEGGAEAVRGRASQEDGAEAVRGRARQEDGARRKGGKRRIFGRDDAVQEAASQQTALREAALREAALREATLREATLREATHGAGEEPVTRLATPSRPAQEPTASEHGRDEASAPEQGESAAGERTASPRERDETQAQDQVEARVHGEVAEAESSEARGDGEPEGRDVRGGTVVPIRSGGQGRKSAAAKPIDTEALRRLRRLAASADAPSDAAARSDARTDSGDRVGSERHEDEVARDQHRKGQPPRLGPALVLPGPHRAWPPLDPNAKPLPRPPAPRPEQPTGDAATGGQAGSGEDTPAIPPNAPDAGGTAVPDEVTATGTEDSHGAATGGAAASGTPADATSASAPAASTPKDSSFTASGDAVSSDARRGDVVSGDAASGGSERRVASGNTGSTEATGSVEATEATGSAEATEDAGSTAPTQSGELADRAEAAGSAAPAQDSQLADSTKPTQSVELAGSADAVRSTGANEPEPNGIGGTEGAKSEAAGAEPAATTGGAEDTGDAEESGERGRRGGGWPRLAPVAPEAPAPATHRVSERPDGPASTTYRVPERPDAPAPAARRAPERPDAPAPATRRAPERPDAPAPAAYRAPERPVAPLRGRPGVPADGRPGEIVAPVPGPRPGEGRVRRVESVVGRDSGGWRRIAQVVVGGSSVRTDGSEIDEARARAVFSGSRRILVLGCTGGAGQSTTALMLGHTFAQYRDDRIVAVDANTGGDTLTSRIEPETPETLTSLLAGLDRVSGYLTMRGYTTRTASGLEVISADTDAGAEQRLADRSLFSDHRLGESMRLLDRHYKLAVIDPAAALAARLLPYADQLVLVVPASEEASEAVAMTYEWLDGHGCAELRRRAVMVVNGVSRRSMADVEQAESVARGRCRAIVRVPWDDDLAPGGAEIVDPGQLRAAGRRAYLALAGVVVAGFAAQSAQTARTAQSAQSVRPSDEELASDPPGTRIGER